jgi:CheY-like chemotaxis protein
LSNEILHDANLRFMQQSNRFSAGSECTLLKGVRSVKKTSSHRPDRILVVDDDEVSLAVISMLLEAEGVSVVQASSGEMAIGIVESLTAEEYPQLVLADLQMPGICGQELATTLQNLLPGASLLAMSASPGSIKGYSGFVRKPLQTSQIWATLEECEKTEPESTAALKDKAVLDEAIYSRLSGMMPQRALDEIYDVCLEDAQSRADIMKQAASKGNVAEVRRHAHAVKGSAGMVGARNLAAVAQDLETGSYESDDIPMKIGNLLFCCDELKRILLEKRP